jgi:hypothetical protein
MGVGYAVKASTRFPIGELTLLVLHKLQSFKFKINLSPKLFELNRTD